MLKLTVISGTNRPGSNTLKLSRYVERHLKTELAAKAEVTLIDLQDLPKEIFEPSSYAQKPSNFQKFCDVILQSDGIVTILPEYNGGAPGIFKYFIDMLPFPASLQRKPATFIGLGDGRFGALRACEHMQQIFEYRNAYIYPERVFIPFVTKELDENGAPKNEMTLKLLHSQLKGFAEFASKLSAG